MHTVRSVQVLLFNTSNSVQHYSIIYTQFNGFKHKKWLDISVWPIDGTLRSIVATGSESNSNEGVLPIPQSFKVWASLSDGLVSGHSLSGGSCLCRDTASILWRVCGVRVIIVGNGQSNMSSNPGHG